MKTLIDSLSSVDGWSGPAGSSFSLNQHPDYISEYGTNSLVIHIPANSMNQPVTKSFASIDLSKCTEVVLSIWSRELKRVNVNVPSDYFYKITFDGTHQFMLPTNLAFESVTFGINGWNAATQITITPTTNNEDWLIISGCYGLYDDIPLDIMVGMQMGLQNAVTRLLPNNIPIGTVSCPAGVSSVTPSATTYLDRGAVVYISDGVNSETHQVERFDESNVWFTSLYDGKTTKFAHTVVPIQLTIPVVFGTMEKEAVVPCIAIWGMSQKTSQDTQDTLIVEDSMDPSGGAALRRMPWMQEFKMLVDCEARSNQVLAIAARAARMFLASSRVWINGRANEMPYPSDSVYIEPKEDVAMIPKLQYEIEIEVHEERAQRAWVNRVSGETLTYTFQRANLNTVEP
jgi:hypothetical protein